jgi:hypothetical protein
MAAFGEARNAEYFEVSPMATDKNDQPSKNKDQREKSAFRFLALCVILTVTFFGLVHGAVHFKDLTGAAIRSKNSKAIIILP